MTLERTLALIKPDVLYKASTASKILGMAEKAGLVVAWKTEIHLTGKQAAEFYVEHQAKPFFGELVDFISSGPVMAILLQSDDAVRRWRELMGPTDVANAPEGTIRHLFALDTMHNAVHGSDSPEAAQREITLFTQFTQAASLPWS